MAKKDEAKTPEAEKLEAIIETEKAVVEAEAEKIVEETAVEDVAEEKATAKAGKRSAKAVREAEEAAEKEERKAKVAAGEVDPSAEGQKKGPAPKTRSTLERRGKNYRKAHEAIEAGKLYTLKEAVELATKTSPTKFDASVELHLKLSVDPRHADQNIRETIVLPNGTGKTVRVAVFAGGDHQDAAKKAGADFVGEQELLDKLAKEDIDFDILVATPNMMAQLGKYAKLLGPRGLMPNPKSGTVTTDVAKAVTEAKAGRIEYRVDSQGIVHMAVGKVSFGGNKLFENATAAVTSVKGAKPASVKGVYIQSITVTTTMGPGITVDASSL